MTDQVLIISAIALFLVVGLMAKNKNTALIEGFSAKRNKLSWFVTAAGVSMTFLGGAALLNMASLGYSYQWYTLADPAAFMIGILISAYFVRKYRKNQGITISQLLSGSNTQLSLYIGIISSLVFLLVIAAQFVAFSKLLAPYFPGVHTAILMILPSAIILLYVFAGGFAAVTNTDVLQLFFILIFLLLPVGWFIIQQPALTSLSPEIPGVLGETPMMKDGFSAMPAEIIIYLGMLAFFVPVSQDINVRAKSAKNEWHARTGIISGGIFYCLTVIACSFIGITMAKHGITMNDPEQTFASFFRYFYPTFGIVAVLAGLAAIWSTLDTYLVNCIAAVAQDILMKNRFLKMLHEKKLIIIAGLLVFSMALFISLFANQVLSLILLALLVYISVLVPVAIGKKLKISDPIILCISCLTTGAIIVCEVFKINVSLKPVVYPASAVLCMLAGRIYQTFLLKK